MFSGGADFCDNGVSKFMRLMFCGDRLVGLVSGIVAFLFFTC